VVLALLATAIAALRFGDVLWPCPVACQGGGHYQRLFGIPSHVLALAGLIPLAVLAWWRPAWAAWWAWVLAGGAVFYLAVSWRLGLLCPYCLAAHTAILATALALWPPRPLLAALGFLVLHFAYHPQVVLDGPAASGDPAVAAFLGGGPQVAAVQPVPERLDALRRIGDAGAPVVVEAAIDLHCPHCAATHGPLLEALRPRLGREVQLVLRFMTRRSDPSGRELAEHVLAADAPARAQLAIGLLLGTPEGRGWAGVRSRVAEVLDPAALEAVRTREAAGIAALLDADARRLRELRASATPFIVVSRAGRELRRWTDPHPDVRAIAEGLP
jgi:hypothetical protein